MSEHIPSSRSVSRRRTIAGLIVTVVILGALFGLSDAGNLWKRARGISPAWTAAASGLALATFVFMAETHRSLLAALGQRVTFLLMLRASFLHLAVSRVLRSGGASGLAVIAWLLRRRAGVPVSVSTAMKLGEFFVTNIVFAAIFLGGALLLLWPAHQEGAALPRHSILFIVSAAGILLILVLLWRAVVLEHRRRLWADRLVRITATVGRVLGREEWSARSRCLVDRGLRAGRHLLSRPARIGRAQGWAVLRIAGSMGAMWACVKAARIEADTATIVLAWCLSKIAAVTLMVPAGLGVIEASLTGVLAASGAAYEAALLAAVLNRVTYHLLPTLVALAMAGPLFREFRSASDRPPA